MVCSTNEVDYCVSEAGTNHEAYWDHCWLASWSAPHQVWMYRVQYDLQLYQQVPQNMEKYHPEDIN